MIHPDLAEYTCFVHDLSVRFAISISHVSDTVRLQLTKCPTYIIIDSGRMYES